MSNNDPFVQTFIRQPQRQAHVVGFNVAALVCAALALLILVVKGNVITSVPVGILGVGLLLLGLRSRRSAMIMTDAGGIQVFTLLRTYALPWRTIRRFDTQTGHVGACTRTFLIIETDNGIKKFPEFHSHVDQADQPAEVGTVVRQLNTLLKH